VKDQHALLPENPKDSPKAIIREQQFVTGGAHMASRLKEPRATPTGFKLAH
jgi:hypothetical protein